MQLNSKSLYISLRLNMQPNRKSLYFSLCLNLHLLLLPHSKEPNL